MVFCDPGSFNEMLSNIVSAFQVLQAMLTHLNFSVLKCVIIASPGFVKDDFMKYVNAQIQADKVPLNEHKSKFVLVHSDSGYKHSLNELLTDESLVNKLSDVKVSVQFFLLLM